MNRRLRSTIIRAVAYLCLAACFALLASCTGSTAPSAPPGPPAVTVAAPLSREIIDHDEFNGRVAAIEMAEVRARVSGYLHKVHFREGDIVKAGTVLFTLDTATFQVEVNRLKADVVRVEAALDLAKNNVERAGRLVVTNAISQEEYDTLSKARDQTAANLLGAKAALAAAQLNLDYTQVKAPFTGRAGRALVTAGNLINGGSSAGTLLTTVVSQDPVHVLFDADESAFLRYQREAQEIGEKGPRPGRKELLLALADEKEFVRKGYLDFVDNRLDPATGTIRARGVFPSKLGSELTPGMFARVKVPGSVSYQAVLIEDRAVSTDLGRRVVLTVDDAGLVLAKPVELGPLHEGFRVIRSGLKPSEWVIVDGLQRARPGAKVTATRTEMKSTDGVK